MAGGKVRLGDVVADIRGGMPPAKFLQKYQISSEKCNKLLKELMQIGVLQQSEVVTWLSPPELHNVSTKRPILPISPSSPPSTLTQAQEGTSHLQQHSRQQAGPQVHSETQVRPDTPQTENWYERLREKVGQIHVKKPRRVRRDTPERYYERDLNLKAISYITGLMVIILFLVIFINKSNMPPGDPAPKTDSPRPSSEQATVQLTDAKREQIRLELVQAQTTAKEELDKKFPGVNLSHPDYAKREEFRKSFDAQLYEQLAQKYSVTHKQLQEIQKENLSENLQVSLISLQVEETPAIQSQLLIRSLDYWTSLRSTYQIKEKTLNEKELDTWRGEQKQEIVGKEIVSEGYLYKIEEKSSGGFAVQLEIDPPSPFWGVPDITLSMTEDDQETLMALKKDTLIKFKGNVSYINFIFGSFNVTLKNVKILSE